MDIFWNYTLVNQELSPPSLRDAYKSIIWCMYLEKLHV